MFIRVTMIINFMNYSSRQPYIEHLWYVRQALAVPVKPLTKQARFMGKLTLGNRIQRINKNM